MGVSSGVIGGVVTTILLSWLASRTNPVAKLKGKRKIIYYGTPVKILGWIILSIGIFIAYAATKASVDQLILASIVGSSLLIAGLALWLEFHIVRIEFDDSNIYTFSPWRKNRIIRWEEISNYSYSNMNNWHRFKTNTNGNIRLSILLSGIGSFFEELEIKNNKIWRQIY